MTYNKEWETHNTDFVWRRCVTHS